MLKEVLGNVSVGCHGIVPPAAREWWLQDAGKRVYVRGSIQVFQCFWFSTAIDDAVREGRGGYREETAGRLASPLYLSHAVLGMHAAGRAK
jgi:hypothetical protein